MKKYILALSVIALAGFVSLTITSCESTPEPEPVPSDPVYSKPTYSKPKPISKPRPVTRPSEGSGTTTSAPPEGSGYSAPSGSGSSY